MRKTLLLAAAMTAGIAFSTTQAYAADVFSRLTSERVTTMLKAAGATDITATKPEAGVEIVTFNDGNGAVNLVLLECTADGCGTLQMSIIFDKDDRFTPAALNSFNAMYLTAQAATMSSGNVALMDLYVPAGGVTEENLKNNLAVFLTSPAQFEKAMQSQVTASVDTKPGAAQPVVAPKALTLGAEAALTAGKFDAMKYLSTKPGRRLR
ncbi:MAG: YbjN domain-containing protein [Alphaproteobacteria bacterium]|nr:YbjN domain-containing protein [Alphaproteobacteria bacterium]